MSKFRKKPVVIEAVQLKWENWSQICDLAGVGDLSDGKPQGCWFDKDGKPSAYYHGDERIGLQIPTLEGLMVAQENDWIIKGVNGEIYPCKPDIFEKTYDPV